MQMKFELVIYDEELDKLIWLKELPKIFAKEKKVSVKEAKKIILQKY